MSYDLYQGCLRFTNRGTSFSVSRPTRSRRLACRAGTAPPLLQTPSHIRSDWPSGGAFQRACPRASFCHTSSDHHTKSAQNLYIIYDVTTCPLPRLDLFSSRIMAPEKPLVVVGSANADLVFNIERLPLAGETMAAFGLETIPGGKVRQRLPKLLNLRHSPWNSLPCCMCCDAIHRAQTRPQLQRCLDARRISLVRLVMSCALCCCSYSLMEHLSESAAAWILSANGRISTEPLRWCASHDGLPPNYSNIMD